METLLDIAESGIEKADDIELLTVESIQQWAEQQAQKKSEAAKDLNDFL